MTDTTQAKVTDTTQAKAKSTLSQALAAFVDALLPGNTEWPSGATLGIQHPMLERLVAQNEENALLGLAQSLESIGAPFFGLDAQARTAALKKCKNLNQTVLNGYVLLPIRRITRLQQSSS